MPGVNRSSIKRKGGQGRGTERNIQLAGTEIKYDSALRDEKNHWVFFLVGFFKSSDI